MLGGDLQPFRWLVTCNVSVQWVSENILVLFSARSCDTLNIHVLQDKCVLVQLRPGAVTYGSTEHGLAQRTDHQCAAFAVNASFSRRYRDANDQGPQDKMQPSMKNIALISAQM